MRPSEPPTWRATFDEKHRWNTPARIVTCVTCKVSYGWIFSPTGTNLSKNEHVNCPLMHLLYIYRLGQGTTARIGVFFF